MIQLGIITSSYEYLKKYDLDIKNAFTSVSGVFISNYNLEPLKSDISLYSNFNELAYNSDALIFLGYHKSYNSLIINGIKNSRHIYIEQPEYYNAYQLSNFIKLSIEANTYILTQSKWKDYNNIDNGLHYISNASLIEYKHSVGFSTVGKPIDYFRKKLFDAIRFNLISIKSNPKKIYSIGISTFTNTIDFINSSIEFDNGSIIRMQIGAIDKQKFITSRIHQKNTIVRFNLSDLTSEANFLNVFKNIDSQEFNKTNESYSSVLTRQLISFAENIEAGNITSRYLETTFEAASLTEQILEKLKIRSEVKQLFTFD